MKYLIIIISAIFVALFENTIGGLSPFVYVPYALFISTVLFWSVDTTSGFIFLGISGLLLDLMNHNWLGTTYLSFAFGLLILFSLNSFVDLIGKEKKFTGALVHLIINIIFNYFLIILQNNKLVNISYEFVIYSVLISGILFGIVFFIISSTRVRRKGLYA